MCNDKANNKRQRHEMCVVIAFVYFVIESLNGSAERWLGML